MDNTEDCGGRAYANREYTDRQEREAWIGGDTTDNETDGLSERVHKNLSARSMP